MAPAELVDDLAADGLVLRGASKLSLIAVCLIDRLVIVIVCLCVFVCFIVMLVCFLF